MVNICDRKENYKWDNEYLWWNRITKATKIGVGAASPASKRSPEDGHWAPCGVWKKQVG